MDLKARFRNPYFWYMILLAIVVPIGTYFGITLEDLTTWNVVWDTFLATLSNPYVLISQIFAIVGVIFEPTTPGLFKDGKTKKSEK